MSNSDIVEAISLVARLEREVISGPRPCVEGWKKLGRIKSYLYAVKEGRAK